MDAVKPWCGDPQPRQWWMGAACLPFISWVFGLSWVCWVCWTSHDFLTGSGPNPRVGFHRT